MTYHIPLKNGGTAIVDIEDAPLAMQCVWYANRDRGGVVRGVFAGGFGRRVKAMLSRAIMAPGAGLVVDHINGDPLDNRRCNLRVCTQKQNIWNRKKPKSNTSGFKGARLDKKTGKWIAYIAKNGRRWHLGTFRTPERAHRAYVAAAKVLHGEFARAV